MIYQYTAAVEIREPWSNVTSLTLWANSTFKMHASKCGWIKNSGPKPAKFASAKKAFDSHSPEAVCNSPVLADMTS